MCKEEIFLNSRNDEKTDFLEDVKELTIFKKMTVGRVKTYFLYNTEIKKILFFFKNIRQLNI